MRIAIGALVAALVLTVAGPAAPARAGIQPIAPPPDGYGFTEGATFLDLSKRALERELDAVSQTRAEWLRVLVAWNEIEPRPGDYRWYVLDRIVRRARAHGLKVLLNVLGTPAWAIDGVFFTAPPRDPADLGRFMGKLATRYRAAQYEIWNEPNLALFFGLGLAQQTLPRYVPMLRASYRAIKKVQPDATVIASGLARGQDGLLGIAPPTFVQGLYDRGADRWFDAVALHPYLFNDGVSPTYGPGHDGMAADPDQGWSDVARVRRIMVENGDRAKKIWFTEVGAPTHVGGGVTQRRQVELTREIFAATQKRRYLGPVFVYSIRDNGAFRGDREQNFGHLFTADWRPKLTATALGR